jgi:hypothetical protein
VALSPTDVWAAGGIGDRSVQPLIEHWDGRRWRIVPSPTPPGLRSSMTSIAALSARDIWAVGPSTSAFGAAQTLTEHWDGSRWQLVPAPNPGYSGSSFVSVAAVSTDDVWAVGWSIRYRYETLAEHWDGRHWSVIRSLGGTGHDSELSSVAAVSTREVWAVGFSGEIGAATTALIEQWTGQRWSLAAGPAPSALSTTLTLVMQVGAHDVWAFGYSGKDQDEALGDSSGAYPLAVHWGGAHWKVVPFPNLGTPAGVAALSPTNIWVVSTPPYPATLQAALEPPMRLLVTHWNGTRWCAAVR